MIQGHKPAGYIVRLDSKGNREELETRQCVHCQAHWIYKPKSKRKYGFCLKCYGLVCRNCLGKECNGPFEKG